MIASSCKCATAVCVLLVLLVACGTNEAPVNPETVLCRGEADVALLVTGGAQPTDICLDTEDVLATIGGDIYDITISMEQNNVTYELRMIFPHRDDFPTVLNVTGDLGAAQADPKGAWLFYREIPTGGTGIESTVASGGTFGLGFSGRDVVTGQLEKITFDMRDASTMESAGTREISEGLFSLIVEVQPTR